MNCRYCGAGLEHVLVDLGAAPLSNNFLTRAQLEQQEVYYPLKVFVCGRCFLVQLPMHARPADIFGQDYAYFSSISAAWVEHARCYTEMIIERLALGPRSQVVEIACNDGYLLQHMVARSIPCVGVEPAAGAANAARSKGVPVINGFFDRSLAGELVAKGHAADLLIGNNVLAHVADINNFCAGLAMALKPGGVITMEFPHLLSLLTGNQFDTIYHEHYSYLSLGTTIRIFGAHGLGIFDVEELPTHGGSLRIYARRAGGAEHPHYNVEKVLAEEKTAALDSLEGYLGFQSKADKLKNDLLAFLIEQKKADKVVAGYAAAAKGNTLLNYAGVRRDLLMFVADASPYKQGKFLPGSHIPVVTEARLRAGRPDVVLLLAWNLADELRQKLGYIGDWGGRFAVAVPGLSVSKP